MSTEISLRPTDEGFASMAMLFVNSITSDAKAQRRGDVREQLASLIDIMRYLGAVNVVEAKKVYDYANVRTANG